MVDNDENILESGPKGTIEYAIRADGSRPAKDGLDKLKKRDYRRYSRFKALFKQFVQTGKLPPSKMDDYAGTKIRKFKHTKNYPYRIPFFTNNTTHYLTHLFKKRGDKDISNNIKVAKDIMKEHMDRLSGKA